MVGPSLAITNLKVLATDKKDIANSSRASVTSIASSAIMSMKSAPATVRALGVVVMRSVLVDTITTTIMNGLDQTLRIRASTLMPWWILG